MDTNDESLTPDELRQLADEIATIASGIEQTERDVRAWFGSRKDQTLGWILMSLSLWPDVDLGSRPHDFGDDR